MEKKKKFNIARIGAISEDLREMANALDEAAQGILHGDSIQVAECEKPNPHRISVYAEILREMACALKTANGLAVHRIAQEEFEKALEEDTISTSDSHPE